MTPGPRDPQRADVPPEDAPAPFTRVRFREGYATDQVDAFVGRAEDALRSPDPALRPEDVRTVRFTPVRLREGYDMAEVDTYLDDVEHRLAVRLPAQRRPADEVADPVRTVAGAQVWVARARLAVLLAVVVVWVVATVLQGR